VFVQAVSVLGSSKSLKQPNANVPICKDAVLIGRMDGIEPGPLFMIEAETIVELEKSLFPVGGKNYPRSRGRVVGTVVENHQFLWLKRQNCVCLAVAVCEFHFARTVSIGHYDSTNLTAVQH